MKKLCFKIMDIRKSKSESRLPRLNILYTLVLSQYSLLANHVTERSCLWSSALFE